MIINSKRVTNIIVIFLLSLIMIIFFASYAYSEDTSTENTYATVNTAYGINHNISAVLYDTNEYSLGGEGVALTQSGIDVSGWNYNLLFTT